MISERNFKNKNLLTFHHIQGLLGLAYTRCFRHGIPTLPFPFLILQSQTSPFLVGSTKFPKKTHNEDISFYDFGILESFGGERRCLEYALKRLAPQKTSLRKMWTMDYQRPKVCHPAKFTTIFLQPKKLR